MACFSQALPFFGNFKNFEVKNGFHRNDKDSLDEYLPMDLREAGQASGAGDCPHTVQGDAEADQNNEARAHYCLDTGVE